LQGSEINAAKEVLANEVTALIRGREAAEAAKATAQATFAGGGLGQDLPTHEVAEGTIGVIDALLALGFAASRGEAKRLIAGGGARLDGEPLRDEAAVITVAQERRLSSGKKKHGILKPA
jgi:tyrosyl-tRNA synthetase